MTRFLDPRRLPDWVARHGGSVTRNDVYEADRAAGESPAVVLAWRDGPTVEHAIRALRTPRWTTLLPMLRKQGDLGGPPRAYTPRLSVRLPSVDERDGEPLGSSVENFGVHLTQESSSLATSLAWLHWGTRHATRADVLQVLTEFPLRFSSSLTHVVPSATGGTPPAFFRSLFHLRITSASVTGEFCTAVRHAQSQLASGGHGSGGTTRRAATEGLSPSTPYSPQLVADLRDVVTLFWPSLAVADDDDSEWPAASYAAKRAAREVITDRRIWHVLTRAEIRVLMEHDEKTVRESAMQALGQQVTREKATKRDVLATPIDTVDTVEAPAATRTTPPKHPTRRR